MTMGEVWMTEEGKNMLGPESLPFNGSSHQSKGPTSIQPNKLASNLHKMKFTSTGDPQNNHMTMGEVWMTEEGKNMLGPESIPFNGSSHQSKGPTSIQPVIEHQTFIK